MEFISTEEGGTEGGGVSGVKLEAHAAADTRLTELTQTSSRFSNTVAKPQTGCTMGRGGAAIGPWGAQCGRARRQWELGRETERGSFLTLPDGRRVVLAAVRRLPLQVRSNILAAHSFAAATSAHVPPCSLPPAVLEGQPAASPKEPQDRRLTCWGPARRAQARACLFVCRAAFVLAMALLCTSPTSDERPATATSDDSDGNNKGASAPGGPHRTGRASEPPQWTSTSTSTVGMRTSLL